MAKTAPKLIEIPLENLIIDEDDNARVKYNLDELKASIESHGQLQPVLVTPDTTDPTKYRVLAGFSRAKAHKELEMATITGILSTASTKPEKLLTQLAENVVRNEMTTYEVAVQLKKLLDAGVEREAICKQLGKSAAWVSNHVGLWDLPTPLQTKCKDEKLGVSHIRFLHPYTKKLESTGIEKMYKDIENKDADQLKAYKDRVDAKLAALAAGKPPKRGEKTAKISTKEAAKISTEASAEAKKAGDEAIGRTKSEVFMAAESQKKKMAAATNPSLRQKYIGRAEALAWILGDETAID